VATVSCPTVFGAPPCAAAGHRLAVRPRRTNSVSAPTFVATATPAGGWMDASSGCSALVGEVGRDGTGAIGRPSCSSYPQGVWNGLQEGQRLGAVGPEAGSASPPAPPPALSASEQSRPPTLVRGVSCADDHQPRRRAPRVWSKRRRGFRPVRANAVAAGGTWRRARCRAVRTWPRRRVGSLPGCAVTLPCLPCSPSPWAPAPRRGTPDSGLPRRRPPRPPRGARPPSARLSPRRRGCSHRPGAGQPRPCGSPPSTAARSPSTTSAASRRW
jgi:hypothetical protein